MKNCILIMMMWKDWQKFIKNGCNRDPKLFTLKKAVELSQRTQAAVQIVSNLPAPSNEGPIYRFFGMPAMRTRRMAGAAAHKSG